MPSVNEIVEALQRIRPLSQWMLEGETYAGLRWLDTTQSKPLDIEIQAAILQNRQDKILKEQEKSDALVKAKDKNVKADDRLDALVKILGL